MKKSFIRKRMIFSLMMCGSISLLSGCTLKDNIQNVIGNFADGDYALDDYSEDEFDFEEEYDFEEPTMEEFDEFSVTPLPTLTDEEMDSIDVDLNVFPETDGIDAKEIDPMEIDDIIKRLGNERYYAYSLLNSEEKEIYRIIYSALMDFGEKIEMPNVNKDVIDRVFSCVLSDNPEIYYVNGYTLITYTRGNKITGYAFSGQYTMTIEDCKKHDKRIEEYVNKCFAGMSKNMDEYSKVKYLYDYIIENTEYDITADNDQNLLSVFEDGRSVCQGYSSAMQYLMLKQGMFCTTIRGVANNEGHAWNIVRIDGDYYHLDVTWGDASYSIANEGGFESLPSLPEVSYEFFCVPTSEIEKTHRINNDFEIPSCVAKKANYFYREGLMFEAVDTEKLKRMFEAGYSNGDESVLIKCADENVYADMKDYLITESKIFDYLQAKNVNYVSLDNFNEMIFYLSQSEVSEADETVNE